MKNNSLSSELQIFSKCIGDFVREFYAIQCDQAEAFSVLRDSLSEGQLQSKLKIVEILKEFNLKPERPIFIGHWHGLLPLMLNQLGFIESALGYEKSQFWSDFSLKLNSKWNWHSECADVAIADFMNCDLIINTSCEHMSSDWFNRVPTGTRLILQSTDYEHVQHVNRMTSLQEFTNSLPHLDIRFSAENQFEVYKRFSVFGVKTEQK